jgi:hypothetical protein
VGAETLFDKEARMNIAVSIPDNAAADLASAGQDPARALLEAYALEGYRRQVLGASAVRGLLGFETRIGSSCVPEGTWRVYALHDGRSGAGHRGGVGRGAPASCAIGRGNHAGFTSLMIVIADTSPINYLVLIEQIEVLPKLYGRILIPPSVYEELQSVRNPVAGHPGLWRAR